MSRFMMRIIERLMLDILFEDFKNIFTTPKLLYYQMDYDKYWEKRAVENNFLHRWPIMVSEINDNSSILDIGCGDGGFLLFLKRAKKNITETGIDISTIGIEKALKKDLNAMVRPLEYYNEKSELFDYVVISEVIEHVQNSEYFIMKGFELAKEKLIISIPNTGYYTYRIRLLFGRFPVQWIHHPGEHLRFWTLRDFKLWIRNLNLKDFNGKIKIVPSNGFPFFWLFKIFPSLFSKQIVYIIEKK